MPQKNTRGVQQDDVWAAADALIAEGLRPTIERVRLKMGRGSPNTVGPLLEAWFATLGPRLGVGEAKEEAGGPPAAVQQASIKLWEAALSHARKEIEMAAAGTRQALTEERTIFESRVAEMALQEAVFAERQEAAERALLVAQEQMADLAQRLREAQALLAERDGEIEALQSKLSAIEQQRDAERQRHAGERGRLEERAAANERRLMQDIDRERQESKLAKAALVTAAQRAEESHQQSELIKKQLTDKLRHADAELRSTRQALASTQERASELRSLLDAQAAAGAATLRQLDLLMANQGIPKSINAAKRVRIAKRPTNRSAEEAQE